MIKQLNDSPGMRDRLRRARWIMADTASYIDAMTAEQINDLLASLAHKMQPETPRQGEHTFAPKKRPLSRPN